MLLHRQRLLLLRLWCNSCQVRLLRTQSSPGSGSRCVSPQMMFVCKASAFAEPLHLAHANLSWCKACTLLRSNGILTQSDGHPHAERHSARWTLNDSFKLFPGSGGKQIRLPPSQPVLSCGDSRDRLVSGVQRRRLVPERNLQANAASSLVLNNGRT